MLSQLHIQNVGIIENLVIDFDDNLNIITGETGAGKSLIIDSIGLITGERASKELIRTGSDSCFVEAYFCNKDEEYVISRELFLNGKNICKINGRLATCAELKSLSSKLIDIYGQHDNHNLLDEKTHIELLDSYSGDVLSKIKNEYLVKYIEYKDLQNKLSQNFGNETERARKLDLLKFQIDEIEGANLKIDEEELLLNRRKILLNSEKISNSLNTSHELLSENILDNLSQSIHLINNISNIDDRYNEILNRINESYYNLQDVVDTIADYAMEVDFDSNEQDDIEERLNVISNLKRKYGKSIDEIFIYLDSIKKEKDFLENSEEEISKLNNKINKLNSELLILSKKITDIRTNSAIMLEKQIEKELQDLEMKKAYIKFQFDTSDDFLENGIDIVQILICTNVGDTLKPLNKIASGGEISRIMLAIKVVLGDYDNIDTMIFDEIDTGISGEAGKAVANKLKLISKFHQVISVTHLASIVAVGDTNFFIDKKIKSGKTITTIKKLNEDEVVLEIARVIAGNKPTDAIIKHARVLREA